MTTCIHLPRDDRWKRSHLIFGIAGPANSRASSMGRIKKWWDEFAVEKLLINFSVSPIRFLLMNLLHVTGSLIRFRYRAGWDESRMNHECASGLILMPFQSPSDKMTIILIKGNNLFAIRCFLLILLQKISCAKWAVSPLLLSCAKESFHMMITGSNGRTDTSLAVLIEIPSIKRNGTWVSLFLSIYASPQLEITTTLSKNMSSHPSTRRRSSE